MIDFDRKMMKRLYGLDYMEALDAEELSIRKKISICAAAKIVAAKRKVDSDENNHKR